MVKTNIPRSDLPSSGWEWVAADDLLAKSVEDDEAQYVRCEYCGNERVRFVHRMRHRSVARTISVGRVCAGKISENSDYIGEQESILRKRADMRSRWLTRRWLPANGGGFALKIDGFIACVKPGRRGWSYLLHSRLEREHGDSYETVELAKLAVFDAYWDAVTRSKNRD